MNQFVVSIDFDEEGERSVAYFNYLLNFDAFYYATIAPAMAFKE
jgi:hypothetical protein